MATMWGSEGYYCSESVELREASWGVYRGDGVGVGGGGGTSKKAHCTTALVTVG